MCVLCGEGSWVFASTVREVVRMAVHRTGDSDCPIGFYEPFSPPYRCDTSLKKRLAQSLRCVGFLNCSLHSRDSSGRLAVTVSDVSSANPVILLC